MCKEWFLSAVLIATGATLFGHFEVKTPPAKRLAKWAIYLGGRLYCRGKRGDHGPSSGLLAYQVAG